MKFSATIFKLFFPVGNRQRISHHKSTTFFTPQTFKVPSPRTSGSVLASKNRHFGFKAWLARRRLEFLEAKTSTFLKKCFTHQKAQKINNMQHTLSDLDAH